MRRLLPVLFVMALAGQATCGRAYGQKVGSQMTFFPTAFKLNSDYSVNPDNGKFLLVVSTVRSKVLYNIWSYHSTFEDAEYLYKRLMEGFKPGGTLTAIEARVKAVMPVNPKSVTAAKYTKIVTLTIRRVYAKPRN